MRNALSKLKNPRIILLILIFCIASILFYLDFFIFAVILILATVLQLATYKGDIKFNIGHVFFLALMFAKHYGISEAIALLVLAGFLPKLYLGDVDIKSVAGLGVESLIMIFVSYLIPDLFILIILALLNYVVMYIFAKYSGDTIPEIATEVGLPLLMNFIYFVSLLRPLTTILALVIAV